MDGLGDEERSDFERLGVVRLKRVFREVDAARMCDRVWEALAREHGMRRGDPATWTAGQPTGFQALSRAGAFDALGQPTLIAALDALLGEGQWTRPKHWGAPLITFPATEASSWDVPSRQWHIDFAARGRTRPLFAVRVLAFLDHVERRAGGTLVLAGSHRLVERFVATGAGGAGHSRDVRQALMRTHPWLRALWSAVERPDRVQRFMVEGALVDGVALRVLELDGAPGDVVLMHPWQFHAPAPNRGAGPRLMLAHSAVRIDWTPS